MRSIICLLIGLILVVQSVEALSSLQDQPYITLGTEPEEGNFLEHIQTHGLLGETYRAELQPRESAFARSETTMTLQGTTAEVEVESCAPYTLVDGPADLSTFIGVGQIEDPIEGYENNVTCTWYVAPAEIQDQAGLNTTSLTVVFNFLLTEYNSDHVYIHAANADGSMGENKLVGRTGEILTPFTWYMPNVTAFWVLFISDTSSSTEVSALPTGFNLTYMSTSSETIECYNDCSGFGTCNNEGKCDCELGHIASDCSVLATVLGPGDTLQIEDVPIGGWVYATYENAYSWNNVLFQFVDTGTAGSDPMMSIGSTKPPTLNKHATWIDMVSWYYSNTDIHNLHLFLTQDTYYIGITNNRLRATDLMSGELSVLIADSGWPNWACMVDCSGNGVCLDTGHCDCDDGFVSSMTNGWGTCEYEVQDLLLDHMYEGELRIGDWEYFTFEIEEDQAGERTLLVELDTTASPHAKTLLLLRKDFIPSLADNYYPSLGAFYYDWADEASFELENGERQSIRIDQADLTAGTYYVGIFNLWEHTGLEFESHDTADYVFYTQLYAAGTPCLRADFEFCSGFECDFNTGECACPENYIGGDCATYADPLLANSSTTGGPVGVQETLLYMFEYTVADLGMNVNITVEKTSPEADAYPSLMIRYDDIPYNQYGENDFHDLTSAVVYGKDAFSLLIDSDEMLVGKWYVLIYSDEKGTEALEFKLSIDFSLTSDCPYGANGELCSGTGTCNAEFGRCLCDEGFTFDDCSAFGPVAVADGWKASTSDRADVDVVVPAIPIDGWQFFSMVLGCEGLYPEILFESASHYTAPLLVLRYGQFPTMLLEYVDYYDFF